MIKALFKFMKIPSGYQAIDTTSNSGLYRDLSPFVLSAPPAKRFENLWQFSKVYKSHLREDGEPNRAWLEWHNLGIEDDKPHRYPMGKGAVPAYSYWNGEKLGYIEARKRIYAPEYAKNVEKSDSFKRLHELYSSGVNIILLDYDAYDHDALGMSLCEVIDEPKRKMGHACVLIMLLKGQLQRCLLTK